MRESRVLRSLVSSEQFKRAFSLHPAGVAIALWKDPHIRGLTLTSVASTSAEPPMFAFSVARSSRRLGSLREAGLFTLVLPSEDQAGVARHFARPENELSLNGADEDAVALSDDGHPVLPGARVSLNAHLVHELAVGSSVLFVAEVDDVRLGHDAPALAYSERQFFGVTMAGPAAPDAGGAYETAPAWRSPVASGRPRHCAEREKASASFRQSG